MNSRQGHRQRHTQRLSLIPEQLCKWSITSEKNSSWDTALMSVQACVNILLFHAVCLLFACAVTFCVSQFVSLTITHLSCFPKCHSENTDSNGKHSKHNGQMCDYWMNIMVQCLIISIWGKLQYCMTADDCNLHNVNLRDDASLYCSTRSLLEGKAAQQEVQ